MAYPCITIAIATYNSQRTLKKTLESIKKQTYPAKNIEILIIDAGSTDKTLDIAKEYHAIICNNPQKEPVFAKHLGFLHAKGNYILFLDSDELLENNRSLELKITAFQQNKKVKAVMPSGYKSPPNESPINDYINEFGDPFSFFLYRESKGFKFLIADWSKRYVVEEDRETYIIFNFNTGTQLPLIELCAGGCMIDVQYFKKFAPKAIQDPGLVAHFFYLLNNDKKFLAVAKQDNTIHYSCPSIQKYFKKLASRVRNNVFNTSMGEGGFDGRERLQPKSFQRKKYFFLPYALSIIFPTFDGIYLAITRRKIIYLLHPVLCLYTMYLILYYYAVKISGKKLILKTYGN